VKSGYLRAWLVVLSGPLNLFLATHGSALLWGGLMPLWGLAGGMLLSSLRRLYTRAAYRPKSGRRPAVVAVAAA
jgi:hypothetical protein